MPERSHRCRPWVGCLSHPAVGASSSSPAFASRPRPLSQSFPRIVKLEPGRRTIVLQSATRKGTPGTDRTVELDVEPCRRYYVNAQFEAAMGDAWKPVVARVEPIPGCKVPGAPK